MDYMDDVIKEVFPKIFNELVPEESLIPTEHTKYFILPKNTQHRAIKLAIIRDMIDSLPGVNHE